MAATPIKTCTECMDALYTCLGIAHQTREYYRNGELDLCDDLKAEMWLCLKAKAQGEEGKAALVGSALDRRRPNVSPTIGVIWDARPPHESAPPPKYS